MITKLTLQNFKGVRQGEITLSPLTILVGTNNAGKTTILEALYLAPNPVRLIPYSGYAAEVVRKNHETLDSTGFSFLLTDYGGEKASIECQMDDKLFSLEFVLDQTQIYLSSNLQRAERSQIEFGPKDNRRKSFGVLGYLSNSISPGDTEPLIGDSQLINSSLSAQFYVYLKNNWASIVNSGIFRTVLKDISETSPEKYVDLTLEPFLANTYSLYAFKEDGKRIRLGDLGEGIQNYILARIIYELFKPDLLLWDDIGSHFNPKILIKLSDWFSKIIADGKQVVLATHSLEAVKLLTEASNQSASVILTSLKDNILSTRVLSLDKVEEFRQAGIDVRIAESLLI